MGEGLLSSTRLVPCLRVGDSLLRNTISPILWDLHGRFCTLSPVIKLLNFCNRAGLTTDDRVLVVA